MRAIVHIGMGKTGTTSIQRALGASGAALAERGMAYRGLWPTDADPAFEGHAGFRAFISSPPAAMRRHAETVARAVEAEPGIDTFVWSNEAMFQHGAALAPFFARLRELMALRLIAYVRDPRGWLPSAHVQWGVMHKAHPGPVRPYPERARQLVGMYDGIRDWARGFGDVLSVGAFAPGRDVVADMSERIGVPLERQAARSLERPEPAEIVLRALFNTRHAREVMPARFDQVVLGGRTARPPRTEELIAAHLDHAETGAIVAEHAETFAFLRDATGIDVTAGGDGDGGGGEGGDGGPPDAAAVRERMLDHLVQIVLTQSQRITRLERQLRQAGIGDGEAGPAGPGQGGPGQAGPG